MGKEIAGVCFIRNGIKLDYCFEASINSMKAFCDHVFVCYVESEDNTLEVLQSMDGITILKCNDEEWRKHQGKDKLSVFQNVAIEYAQEQGYAYVFLCQGDEVVHEDSIPFIRQALALKEDAYYVTRHNLWGDTGHVLNVPQHRKPCSSVVNRFTKSCYRSVDDGESIASKTASLDFINKIDIWHMGFVRNAEKHVAKIKEIQGNIFLGDVDSRVVNAEKFDAWGMGFDKTDVIPINKPLPVYLNKWVSTLNK